MRFLFVDGFKKHDGPWQSKMVQ